MVWRSCPSISVRHVSCLQAHERQEQNVMAAMYCLEIGDKCMVRT